MFDKVMKQVKAGRKTEDESGFTLIELLVVIIILGILAAVVVFAVGGIGDKGQTASCKIDTRTLRTAEEAYSAQSLAQGGGAGKYTDIPTLKAQGFLSEDSTLHAITGTVAANDATHSPRLDWDDFTINVKDAKCGTAGQPVNGSTNF